MEKLKTELQTLRNDQLRRMSMMNMETAPTTPRKKGGGDTKAKTAGLKKPQRENIKGGGDTKAKTSASKPSSRRETTLNEGRGIK